MKGTPSASRRALEDIRRRLGHPGGANWFRRLALEAAEHLGSSFHFRAEDFDRSFDFQDMIGKLEAMERDAKE